MVRKLQALNLHKVFFIFLALLTQGTWATSGITYHGRLLKPDGSAVTASNVQFRLQIRTPGVEDCLLYEEIQTANLSTTKGMFSLSLGDGTGARQDANAWNLFGSLSNRKSFSFSVSDCTGANVYNPSPSDNRKFRVMFNDGTFAGWESLPIQAINFIPMSIESYAVGGFPASSLLRVETGGVLNTTSPLNNTQYNALVDLVNGNSSLYTKAGQLNGVALPVIGNGESVRWNSGAWQAYTPLATESDPTVEAFAKASLPICGVGTVLKSDGTSLSCVTDLTGGSPADATDTTKGVVVVPTGSGLVVSSGSLSLPDQALTPGSFAKVTVDQKGIVTAGGNLAEADIPTLTTAGKVSGGAIDSGTIGGSTAINTSGNIQTSGTISSAGNMTVTGASGKVSATYGEFRRLNLMDDDVGPTPNYIEIRTPSNIAGDYTMTLPGTNGTSNQVLGMNNAANGMEYKSITAGTGIAINHTAGGIEIEATGGGGGGSVNGVTGTAPISVDNTDPTNPVVSLANTGTAGTYGSATQVPVITTDAKGRITGVTNTTIAGTSPVGATLAEGQTWVGDGSNEAEVRYIGLGDIKTSVGTPQFPTACTAAQTMVWSAITDVLTCTDIEIPSSKVTGLTATNVSNTAAGNIAATNVQAALNELDTEKVKISGDTMTGTLNLPANGLVVGTNQLVVNGGNVGIGTTSPSRLLHVNGPMRVTASALPGTPATGDIAVDSGDSNKLKWYNGSAWQAAGGSGGGGRTGCPAGFTLIGTSGELDAFCISTNEETSATWLNAVTACYNKSPKARLCSAGEWAMACVAGTPVGMTGNWEWVADLYNVRYGQVMGNSGCDSFYGANVDGSDGSRCCFR